MNQPPMPPSGYWMFVPMGGSPPPPEEPPEEPKQNGLGGAFFWAIALIAIVYFLLTLGQNAP